MARKPTGKPTGRPHKDFDHKIFENLCYAHCTVNEVEAILQSDQRVIDGWCKRYYGEDFSTCYKRFSMGGNASLRRNQMNLSKRNASMCIWLGKQYLGQRDMPQDMEKFSEKLGALLDILGKTETSEDFNKEEVCSGYRIV